MSSSKAPAAFDAGEPAKNAKDFATDLQVAMNNAITFRPYKKTGVFAFHWGNDDMGVRPLEQELLKTFREQYGFSTTSYTVPLVDSQITLAERLIAWSKDFREENTLRIVVYSGHAANTSASAIHWNLAGKCNPQTGKLQGPTINWWGVASMIESVPGKICYVFDCCSAGSGALKHYDGAEFVAASGWGQQATKRLDQSFTQILINRLRELQGETQTLAQMFGSIFRNARSNGVGACPVHILKQGRPSVTIGRNVVKQPHTGMVADDCCRVLLSVRVRGDLPAEAIQWKQWLAHNIPQSVDAVEVKIEGAFGGSTVLLFTCPTEIWTMLPADDPCYTFIAHVKTHNLLLHGPTESYMLPMRSAPQSRKENEPPRASEGK
ncbi:hypothetical protein PoHVEF18_004673 [Penicillium ochrochloron]